MESLRILLADDHTLVRQGLRKVLEEKPEWKVIAEAGDGREAVRLAEQHQPDVAIVDVAMPQLNGIESTRQMVQKVPKIAVLALSMHADEVYVAQIFDAGARGYLLKDSADTDLFEAVEAVASGKSFLSPAVARATQEGAEAKRNEGSGQYSTLSKREREIFQLIAECNSNKQIAALLGISPSTVETHRARIMEKLDLHSAAEITLYAMRRGIIQ